MDAETLDRFRLGGITFFPETSILWGDVPKVASTSLREVFESVYGRAVTFKDDAEEYRKLVKTTASPTVDWFRFFFVRNPYDRFVSLFEYAKKTGLGGRVTGFEHFVKTFRKRNERDEGFRAHARPASDWNVLDPNYVGHFETLFADVCQVIEWTSGRIAAAGLQRSETLTLPHKNATDREPWHDYFVPQDNDRAIDLVRDFYLDDLRMGYTAI